MSTNEKRGESMPRTSYEYGTSPRKYEPEYTNRKNVAKTTKNNKNTQQKAKNKKVDIKNEKEKKAKERLIKAGQMVLIFIVFIMLFTLSYREIAIMEMFNQKKTLENKLATVQKENGQVEKSITEVESSLDWNSIQQKATDELGMQKKAGTPVNLDKSDNVETSKKFIQSETTSLIDRIIIFLINK